MIKKPKQDGLITILLGLAAIIAIIRIVIEILIALGVITYSYWLNFI